MSCCSSDTSHPNGIARLLVRVGFGLSLVFAGIGYYREPQFAESVARGLDVLEPVGMVWGYILPALFIIGGVLLTLGLFMNAATWIAGIALVSIPVGIMLRTVFGISVNDMMLPSLAGWLWVVIFMYAVKGGSCSWMHKDSDCACCADGSCDCGCHGKTVSKSVVSKSAPVKMPVASKAPAKKSPAKKK